MKTLAKHLLTAATLLSSAATFADTGAYAGFDAGRMKVSDSSESASDNSFGGHVGYNFGSVALEGAFHKQTGAKELEVYALPRISLTNTVSLIGKAGIRRSSASENGFGTSTAYVIGAGAEMSVSNKVYTRILVDYSPKSFGFDSIKAVSYHAGIGFKF